MILASDIKVDAEERGSAEHDHYDWYCLGCGKEIAFDYEVCVPQYHTLLDCLQTLRGEK